MSERVNGPNANSGADEAFFILRDSRDFFRDRLVEILRDSGAAPAPAIKAFATEIEEAHDELASTARQGKFGETAGLTASRISLVGNDDLELEIRIGDLINRLKDNERIDCWRVQLRYMNLLQRPGLDAAHTPVGLEPINTGLWVLCKNTGYGLERNLEILARIEEWFQLRLPDLYADLNTMLEQRSVEPAQARIVQRPGSPTSPTSASVAAERFGTVESPFAQPPSSSHATVSRAALPDDPLAALRQNVLQGTSGREVLGADFILDDSFLAPPSRRSDNPLMNASAAVMLSHIGQRLAHLEQQKTAGKPTPEAPGEPPRAIKAKDLDLPLGRPAAIAVDTLALVFEAIFAHPDLPGAIKEIIGRLQPILLKASIADPVLFTDTGHPLRRLINGLARAAIGLGKDTASEHPVCQRLATLVENVCRDTAGGSVDITVRLDELTSFIAERDNSVRAAAKPYAQLVVAHEAPLAAEAFAQDWLDRLLVRPMPDAVREFLSTHWLRAMRRAYLEGGRSGQRWKDNDLSIRELLWSIEPKATAEERTRLMSLIPALIKRINAALDDTQVSAAERKPFLDACFELQTAAMRNRPLDLSPLFPERTRAVGATGPGERGRAEVLERGGTLVQYLGAARTAAPSWQGSGKSEKDGVWIEFSLDGDRLCGCRCWQGPPWGTVLLFNPDWGFAVALAPAALDKQLGAGNARVVSGIALFDVAAESALSGRIPR